LGGGRPAVDAAPPLGGELEVLDRVGHIDGSAIDARLLERSVQDPPGGADERRAFEVLLVPRLFTDEQEAGVRRALAEHRLRGVAVQAASSATGGGTAQLGQSVLSGKVSGGAGVAL